jgi:hypothetical protein
MSRLHSEKTNSGNECNLSRQISLLLRFVERGATYKYMEERKLFGPFVLKRNLNVERK